ncbi:MAG TPA: hypothetical protein VFO45_02360 [Sphingomicrobium sp.]|nr:hypothetical protein [Sphingomicrobium sp.]
MSKHWNPDAELAWLKVADDVPPARPSSWPEGATAGLVLVAVACFAFGVVLYQFAGPREVIEESVARR